jgi:pyridoxal 5'-phosphate synthase pdxS subunit
MRKISAQIRQLQNMPKEELMTAAKNLAAPYDLVCYINEHGKLPVVNFAAGGIATPADAALMMQLGCDGVFVGSGIFESETPEKVARAIVEATTHFQDYELIARVSKGLGEPMKGIDIRQLAAADRMQERGW